jgi:tetratricopeptide (TPR) repeat protein
MLGDVEEPAALERARVLLQAQRPREALQELAQEPEGGEASLLRAWALTQLGYLVQALKETERAVRSTPESSEAFTLRSLILLALDRARAALKAGREAVRLNPHDAVAHAARGRAAVEWGEWKEAEAAATEAIRLAPTWTDGYLVMGDLEMKRGRKKEAEPWFRQAVKIDPTDAMALDGLAKWLAKQRRNDEARSLLETAARTDPSAEPVLDNLYRQTFHHLSGRGPADRLDIAVLTPFLLFLAIDATIVLGWIHPPALLTAASIGITLLLVVVYSVLDGVRSRRRYVALRTPVQLNYRRRLARDSRQTLGFILYFTATCVLPAIVLSIVVQSAGAAEWLQWTVAAAVLVVWIPPGAVAWLAYVRPWLMREG